MVSDVIMIIEDEKPIRIYTSKLLQAEGYSVVEATSGKEGLALADRVRPQVILSDVNLGDMSGFAVLDALRQTPQTRQIPFLFLSGNAWAQEMQISLRLQADQFLLKPVLRMDLLAAVAARLASPSLEQLARDRAVPACGAARATWIFETGVRPKLGSRFQGWWVAIEHESGRCFLGQSEQVALQIAQQSMPGRQFSSMGIAA